MKITKVDIYLFKCDSPAPMKPVGCRIYTDEGLYGDGEASMSYGVGAEGAFGMVEALAHLVLGMDPLDNEVIWDKMHKTTFWGQAGGPAVYSGMSAIDIALWDIRGKYFNAPLYRLLGGKQRDNLRCYASQLQLGFGPQYAFNYSVDDYAQIAKKVVVEDGYDAVKVDFMSFNDAPGKPMGYEQRKACSRPNTSPWWRTVSQQRARRSVPM